MLAVMSAGAYGAVQAGTYNTRLLVARNAGQGRRVRAGASPAELRRLDRPGQNSALVEVRREASLAAGAAMTRPSTERRDWRFSARGAQTRIGATRRERRRRGARGSGAAGRGGPRSSSGFGRRWPGPARSSPLFLAARGSACGSPRRARRASPAWRCSPRCSSPRSPRSRACRRPTRRETLAPSRPRRARRRIGRPPRSPIGSPTPATTRRPSALWRLHRRRLARAGRRDRAAPPSPRMALRDPRALRFAALMLALVAAIVAGPERYARVAAAFDWRGGSAAAAAARLDAWIDPPAYTGKPPILLDVSPQAGGDAKTRRAGGLDPRRARRGERDRGPRRGRADAARERQAPRARRARRSSAAGPFAATATLTLSRDGSPFAAFDIAAIAAGTPTITLDRSAAREFERLADAPLRARRSLRRRERRGGIRQAGRRRRGRAAARADRGAEAGVAIAEHGERRRRGEHDQRSLRAPLGRRRSRR